MVFLFDFSLPFTDPVLVFSVVLFIIFFAPILLKKLHIPGLVGLIVAGVMVGPNGFNLLLRNSSIVLFGTVGLLYIMFLAGLEIDMSDFKKSRNRSIVFGAFTFFVPIAIGFIVTYYFLQLELQASILLASMFASHTLVSYPIASKLGITKTQPVTIAIGGTIIADTAVLLVLAVISGSVKGNLNAEFWLRLGVSLVIFSFVVLWVFPRITRWFFKNVQEDGGSHYIFILGMVFAAAFLAELAGVEPIIGAFLAGLALNRLIPHTSALMNRIEFIGNNLFIPFFLISVGMIVDVKVLFTGYGALLLTGALIFVSVSGKFLAAFLTQKVFNFSSAERNIIYGLTGSHAAATLAVVMVGYRLNLFDENILNGSILLILFTCLISSFVTENAGRKLAVLEADKNMDLTESEERILIAIANPISIEQKIDLAIMLKDPKSTEPISILSIVKDDEDAKEKVRLNNKMLQSAIKHASITENSVSVVTRIDLNIANGISRAIKEKMISEVILGWHEKSTAAEKIFGSVLDGLLEKTEQMILVTKIIHPINILKKIIVVVPPNAELEIGFARWIRTVRILASQTGSEVIFFGETTSLEKVKQVLKAGRSSIEATYVVFAHWDDFLVFSRKIGSDDLFIIVSARRGTLSHSIYLENIPNKLSRYFEEHSFIIIYPEQYSVDPENRNLQLDGMTTVPIGEDIQRINKLGRLIRKIFKK